MSDLAGERPTVAPSGNERAQKSGSQNALGPVPIFEEFQTDVRTPTDIMRHRRNREAKRKAENEPRQRQQDEEAQYRQEEAQQGQEEAILNTRRTSAAGVVPRVGTGEEEPSRRQRILLDFRVAGTDPSSLQNSNDRMQRDRFSSSDARISASVAQSTSQSSVYVPAANRTQRTPRVSDPSRSSYQSTARPRATSVSKSSQSRLIQFSVRATSATQRPIQASQPSSVDAVNSKSHTRVNRFGAASAFQGGPTSRTRVQPLPEQSRFAQS